MPTAAIRCCISVQITVQLEFPHRACQRIRNRMKLHFMAFVTVFVDKALLRGSHCKNMARGDWLTVAPKCEHKMFLCQYQ